MNDVRAAVGRAPLLSLSANHRDKAGGREDNVPVIDPKWSPGTRVDREPDDRMIILNQSAR